MSSKSEHVGENGWAESMGICVASACRASEILRWFLPLHYLFSSFLDSHLSSPFIPPQVSSPPHVSPTPLNLTSPLSPPPVSCPLFRFPNTCPFTTLPLRFPHFSLPQRCYPFKEEAPCLHGRNVAHLEIHTFCYLRTLRYTCAKRHETRVHWPKGIFFITHVRNPPLKTRGENTGNVEVNIVLAYHVKFKVPSRL